MNQRDESIAGLQQLVSGIRVAMLTTAAADGSLHSRPMMTGPIEADATLWFLTGRDAAKTAEIASHRRVNVSCANPEAQTYVSMAGTARVVADRRRVQELWSDAHRAWFPEGPDDPNVVPLRVSIESAEYWDAASGRMVALGGFGPAVGPAAGSARDGRGGVTLDTSGN